MGIIRSNTFDPGIYFNLFLFRRCVFCVKNNCFIITKRTNRIFSHKLNLWDHGILKVKSRQQPVFFFLPFFSEIIKRYPVLRLQSVHYQITDSQHRAVFGQVNIQRISIFIDRRLDRYQLLLRSIVKLYIIFIISLQNCGDHSLFRNFHITDRI